MAQDLNVAAKSDSGQMLRAVGLENDEIVKIQEFIKKNSVFVKKRELLVHELLTKDRYDVVKDEICVIAKKRKLTPYRTMSTREYRDQLRRQGHELRPDWHVGHIVASANKGADSDSNYVLMHGSYNQRLQHLYDGVIFAHVSLKKLRHAVCSSRALEGCPLTYKKACDMRKAARKDCQQLKLFKEGEGLVVGGAEAGATDGGDTWSARLLDPQYCERLIKEWKEKFE